MAALTIICLPLLLSSCGDKKDEGSPMEPLPTFATWRVDVDSPNDTEGGAVLTVAAEGVASVEAVEGQIYTRRRGDQIRVVMLRAVPGKLSLRIHLEADGPAPAVDLLEVASPINRLRNLIDYHLVTTGE